MIHSVFLTFFLSILAGRGHKLSTFFIPHHIVLTDCDYSLLLDGKETTHHFMVTEVYAQQAGCWKLCTFSFTALVY